MLEKFTEEIVAEKELLTRNLQENREKNAGDLNIRKMFNKCILINKWYYKTIVLNIGPRMRPPAPSAAARAHARSARSRPLAAARLAPLRRAHTRTPSELTPLPTVSICFNLFEYVSIRFNTFHYVSIRFNPFQSVSI